MRKKTYHPKGHSIVALVNGSNILVPNGNSNNYSYSLYYEEITYNNQFQYWKKAKGSIVINPKYIICTKTY